MSSVMYKERAVMMGQPLANRLSILRWEGEVGFLPHCLDTLAIQMPPGTAVSRPVATEAGKPRGP